jgi:hypothetical protein
MRRTFTYDRFAFEEFAALIEYLKKKECLFYSCLELGKSLAHRGVSFRYDIHVRDIAGAYGFLAVHYQYNIPVTFFLLADDSNDEYERLSDFLWLARRVQSPVEIGIYDSPVDSYFIKHKFLSYSIPCQHMRTAGYSGMPPPTPTRTLSCVMQKYGFSDGKTILLS